MNKIKFNSFYIMLGLVILSGIFIRTKLLLYSPSLWIDECSLVWNILDSSFGDFFKPLKYHQQVAPPLFLVTTKLFYNIIHQFTNNIDLLDISLRTLPYICGCLTLPLFAYFTYSEFKNKLFTLLSTSFLAYCQVAVNYGCEVKQYGVDLFSTLILLTLFLKTDFSKDKFNKFFVSSLICIISVWFSSPAVLLILTGSVIAFRNNKKFWIFQTFNFINFILYYFIYVKPNSIIWGNWMKEFWTEKFFTTDNFIKLFASETLNSFWNNNNIIIKLTRYNFINPIFYLLLFLGLYLLFNYCRKQNKKRVFYFLIIPIISIVFGSFFHLYPFSDRLILFLTPLFIIIFFSAFLYLNSAKILHLFYLIIFVWTVISIRTDITYFNIHKSFNKDLYKISKNYPVENIIVTDRQYMCYGQKDKIKRYEPTEIFNFKTDAFPKGTYNVLIGEYGDLMYLDSSINKRLPKFVKQQCNITKYIKLDENFYGPLFFAQIQKD